MTIYELYFIRFVIMESDKADASMRLKAVNLIQREIDLKNMNPVLPECEDNKNEG